MDMSGIFLAIDRSIATRKNNSAWNGSQTDYGASILETQMRFYKYGREGILPPEWEEYKRIADREKDPEWAELQRLKKKFGE